jgi:hypothetical protein
MGKEKRLIPEIQVPPELLEEVIRVIKIGLLYETTRSPATVTLLGQWCDDREKELHGEEHPDQPEAEQPVFNTAEREPEQPSKETSEEPPELIEGPGPAALDERAGMH